MTTLLGILLPVTFLGQPTEVTDFERSLDYVGARAIGMKPKQKILDTLLAWPDRERARVFYVDSKEKEIAISKNTLISTTEEIFEDPLPFMGRTAHVKVGPISGRAYKSTLAYHKKWFPLHMADRSTETLWKSFKRPGTADPCVGFSFGLYPDSEIAPKTIFERLSKGFGSPTKQSGSWSSESFNARWVKPDRVLDFSYDETAGALFCVVFKP